MASTRPRAVSTAEVRIQVVPRSPLRLPGGGREGIARARGPLVERLIHVGDAPVVLRASLAQGRLDLVARARTDQPAEIGMDRLRFWTGADEDLSGFFDRFRDDPLIGPSVRAAPHARPWRGPMPFEVLVWAVCEQLITDERALAIKRRIVRGHGRRDRETGLRDAPSAEIVAALSPALLQRCGLSASRSRALIAAAREVASGRVDLDAPPADRAAGVARLRAIPGIGPWTIAVLALHGQGDMDAIPAGDHAYRMLVGRVMSGHPHAKASEDDVLRFMEPYRGWRGLAGWHFLRAGAAAIAAASRHLPALPGTPRGDAMRPGGVARLPARDAR